MGMLTFSDLEITVLSKDAAVVLGSWSLKREKDNPGGKFTLIFRKFNVGWRIVHDHTS
jgi:ketosteroid isomerase-like protein